MSGRKDGAQTYFYSHDQSTPVLAHEPCKATHERNMKGMTRLLVQHLLYHSKGEMLRWEQSKGHGKGTRAWQKTYKLVRLNLFYEVKEYYWKTSFNKSQAIKKPYNLLPKKC